MNSLNKCCLCECILNQMCHLTCFIKKIENTCNSLIVIVKNTNIFQDVIMKTSKNSKKKYHDEIFIKN